MSTVAYNHDIFPSDVFLEQFPALRPVLDGSIGGDHFRTHDSLAKRAKARWILLGRLSLALTIIALLGIATELTLYATGQRPHLAVTVAIETIALVAIGLLILDHLQHNKANYLYHCFCRERIRHFHFQAFLDGQLISRLTSQPDSVVSELTLRLQRTLLERFQSGDGSMSSFIAASTSRSKLLHPITQYDDRVIEEQVFLALAPLRFEHQADYPRRKTSRSAGGSTISLKEQYTWIESLAKVCLLLAVLLPAIQLLGITMDWMRLFEYPKDLKVLLFGVSVGCAVLAAGARAYCVGMSLPDELDSYDHYVSHIDALAQVASASPKGTGVQQQCLAEIELEAERELRRFLSMKQKATYVA